MGSRIPRKNSNVLTSHLDVGPIVTLTVDDCWESHAHRFNEAFSVVSIRGVFYVIAGFVGKEINGFRFIDWDALRQVSAQGHEIGSHSFTHKVSDASMITKAGRLVRLARHKGLLHSARQLANTILQPEEEYPVEHLSEQDELAVSKLEIEKQLGRPCNSYSYPGGQLTSALKDLVRDTGYSSARTTILGFNNFDRIHPYTIRTQVWDRKTTAKTADRWVNHAIRKRLWLVEVFHAIDFPGYLYSCSESALKQHLSYIHSKKDEIQNLTVTEAIGRIHQK